MNCPYCGAEMEKGVVQAGDSIETFLKSKQIISWIPEKDNGQFFPKKVVRLSETAEGYYCDKCEKVIATFGEFKPREFF